MRSSKEHTEQGSTSSPLSRRRRTALGTTTALALLGMGLIFLLLFFLFWVSAGQVILPVLALVFVLALTAAFVATGVRWASVLGSLVALATMIFLFLLPLGGSALRHPTANVARFSELVLIYALAMIALLCGVAAAIQHARGRDHHAPRWLGSLLVGVGSLAAGMIVVALLVAASPQSSSATTTSGGMPMVHMAGSNFLTDVVLVPKGAKLLLVDDDGVEHIIENGSWTQTGIPHAQEEPGAPVVRHQDITGGSLAIGPFTTAGVFHLYCTIHRGMNLTIVVQ